MTKKITQFPSKINKNLKMSKWKIKRKKHKNQFNKQIRKFLKKFKRRFSHLNLKKNSKKALEFYINQYFCRNKIVLNCTKIKRSKRDENKKEKRRI